VVHHPKIIMKDRFYNNKNSMKLELNKVVVTNELSSCRTRRKNKKKVKITTMVIKLEGFSLSFSKGVRKEEMC